MLAYIQSSVGSNYSFINFECTAGDTFCRMIEPNFLPNFLPNINHSDNFFTIH